MTPAQAVTKLARRKQPAGQMPRHDCHGVHPDQTHEEWLASVAEKKSSLTSFGGRAHMTEIHEKQAFSPFLGAPGLGALLGGAHGAYKAPKGSRPEGFGRGAYQGGGAGLGAILGAGAGGIGGGVLGTVISNALSGGPRQEGDRRYLPLILALLGAGAGGYGGGKLGWRMAKGVTGDSKRLDEEEEEKEAKEKKASDLQMVKQSLTGFLPKALGSLGKGLGHAIGGGSRLWGQAVMSGLKAPGFIPKATAVTGGGLSLAALNEILASTKGGPVNIPHFGMGGDQPWWDPMMQHDRIDPKKTGFKSLYHMATRPIQTVSSWSGMSRRPGPLSDYSRVISGGSSRLSDFLSNPKNFKIDPVTGHGTVTGEVPIDIADVLLEQIDDFQKKKQRFEDMGIIGRFGYGDNNRRPGSRTYTDPWGRPIRRRSSRRRFD